MGFSRELPLSPSKIKACRKSAKSVASVVEDLVARCSSVGIERSLLRLVGMNGAAVKNGLWFPSANICVDKLEAEGLLADGVLYHLGKALLHFNASIPDLEKKILEPSFSFASIPNSDERALEKMIQGLSSQAIRSLKEKRIQRQKVKKKLDDPAQEKRPLKYVIVATGNIFEDITQAKSAAMDGADTIAVIRSTAQSLLDYVPHGATKEGFGGTYATQENFRLMREALDEVGKELGRYIRLTNYSSGLCMSEIAALAAIEGLDCLLNDAMYGILFRDINMRRTLIDQHFSRSICAFSGIWIMTGEDNYMKTTDAVESGDQVLASQFINEQTALNAGVHPSLMAIGHAMEMDPFYDRVIEMEIARAQMTRQIFPEAPLKYMCNTKYKTGDIFFSHAVDTVFNWIGAMTGQGTILLGMPTEAVHTPWLQDRSMSIRCANYLVRGTTGLSEEIGYRTDGFIAKFAEDVLDRALKLLKKIEEQGMLKAIEKRSFAGVARTLDGGKGARGVFEKNSERYRNPFLEVFSEKKGKGIFPWAK